MISEIKKDQKKEGRSRAKKRTSAEISASSDPKQAKLISFGIVRYAEKKSSKMSRPSKADVSIFYFKERLF